MHQSYTDCPAESRRRLVKINNLLFYLFHSKTGLVTAAVSKAIVGWISVSSSHPQSRPGGKQLEGASSLPILPPVRESRRQSCPAGLRKVFVHKKNKVDTDG